MAQALIRAYRRWRGGKRAGATLLVVMVALTCLMGAAAVTVDVGQMMMVASRAQSVADACALAGAAGPIAGQADAVILRIQQTLDANNRDVMIAGWEAADLEIYGAGESVPGYGPIGARDEALAVLVQITSPYAFARVFGMDTQDVVRRAIALRSPSPGGNTLLFALSPEPGALGIDISGSRAVFDGILHSNARVDVSGSDHRFAGAVEWRDCLRITGSGAVLEQGTVETTVQPDPVGLTPEDFEPYDFVIDGDYKVPSSGVVPPGCYRVGGKVKVTGSGQRLERVTFVADGAISFSGSNHFYTPNRLGVFAYSLSDDSNSAISIAGSGAGCEGLLYAPNGGADFTGSGTTTVSVVAKTIDISGSDFHASAYTEWGTPTYTVRLVN